MQIVFQNDKDFPLVAVRVGDPRLILSRVAEKFFLALSDRTRLPLLNLMQDGEVCVCFFTEVLQSPQPTISRHLA
jgi:ArsR family transcriptional regulator